MAELTVAHPIFAGIVLAHVETYTQPLGATFQHTTLYACPLPVVSGVTVLPYDSEGRSIRESPLHRQHRATCVADWARWDAQVVDAECAHLRVAAEVETGYHVCAWKLGGGA